MAIPNPTPMKANASIERQLDQRLRLVAAAFESDAMAFYGPLSEETDDLFRSAVEDMKQRRGSKNRLTLLLTTNGGFIGVVQRIVTTIRHHNHYTHLDVVVPNYAFSAGTVLALSADAIYMDYYSQLGPIDPQIPMPNGQWVSALGYLAQWNRLMEKANGQGGLNLAELHLMINGFDQGALYSYEQSAQLSVTLLRKWLASYKFKDWIKTETHGKEVTQRMREDRAKEIALALNDTSRWHVHGHGISMAILEDELNLRIDNLDKMPAICGKVRAYHSLLDDYMTKNGDIGAIHTVGQYQSFA